MAKKYKDWNDFLLFFFNNHEMIFQNFARYFWKKNAIIFFDIFPFAKCDMYLDIKDLHYK